ncbi:MAG: hypothetical protein ACTSYJ_02400 [Candidatus Thorarchaeota archaeon]
MTVDVSCILCGASCMVQNDPRSQGSYIWVSCMHCGDYGITSDAQETVSNITLGNEKLAMLMRERKLSGFPSVILTTVFTGEIDGYPAFRVNDLLSNFPKPHEFFDRIILNLSHLATFPTDSINLSSEDMYLLFCHNHEGIRYVLHRLVEEDLVEGYTGLPCNIRINPKGWQRINALESIRLIKNPQAFVAMWFTEEMEEVYTDGIQKAIESDGITRSVRVDLIEHNTKICDRIIAEIRKSKYLVADFTGNRGGVYYEAGFAHGLGIPVIFCVSKLEMDMNGVHFDTQQYNHIIYENPEQLREKLEARIKATII